MEEVLKAVSMVAEIRKEITAKIEQGMEPEQGLLEVLAGLLEAVAGLLRVRLSTFKWKQFYRNMHKGYIPADLCDWIQRWEREAYLLISQYVQERGVCNICKKKVNYQQASIYFREQQKKHGFPYWNAVFESLSRKSCVCPACQSLDWERMISLFLDRLKPVGEEKLRVLYIAPDQALDGYLRKRDDMEYVSFRSDIQELFTENEKTYDVIICSHILEYVENDRKVMAELRQIMKEDGVCVFLVSLVIGLDKTDEMSGLPVNENWKRFGQNNHIRLYGREDFLKRLTETGFLVHILRSDFFGKEIWKRNGLSDIHCLYVATKKDIGLGAERYQADYRDKEELVSVIIPTYNRESLISRSIESVLNQTYRKLEVIVVDDASTDDTEAVIQKIRDERVRYIKLEENGGANHARNVGLKTAHGNYIAFNDSDDEWLPAKLEKQMKLMRQPDLKDVGCVYCVMTRYYNEKSSFEKSEMVPDLDSIGEDAVGDLFHFMQSHMFISTQMLLLKKEVIENVGYFNENLKRLQDWELLLRIAKKYKFMLVQENLVNAYMQTDSISTNVQGAIDTIRYVVQLYNMNQLNVRAYECLMNSVVGLLGDTQLTDMYKEKTVMDIEQDGVFSEERIREIRDGLNIYFAE